MRITALSPRTDARGSSFPVELPAETFEECHVATLRAGGVRGNHFHTRRHELLIVVYAGRWTLLWDDGEGTPVQSRTFDGAGAVLVEAEPMTAHAVRNDGVADLQLFVLGDIRHGDETRPRILAQPLTKIAGIDGCRTGWVAAILDGALLEARVVSTDDELVALLRECAVAAIDIPIGLAEHGPRSCDHHARRFLGRRASCVFPAPLRPLLALGDYAEANRLARQLQGRGISRQGWAIVGKVAQVDRLLQRHHELRARVSEVHPEVSFAMWNGGAALEGKRTEQGLAARRTLAAAHFGTLPPVPRGAHEDDLLDAVAALWTAERIRAGRSRELGDARADVTGLPMRIVV